MFIHAYLTFMVLFEASYFDTSIRDNEDHANLPNFFLMRIKIGLKPIFINKI